MTVIRGLTIQDEKANGKVYYEPAVLTVKGTSQYNDDQISFVEIEGFWQLPETFAGERKPPEGTVAKFNLSTNPKRGQNAKPGSMYMDITGIYKVGDDEQPIAPQQAAPQGDPREEWQEDTEPSVPSLTLDQRIAKAQALNLLFDVLNSPHVEVSENLIPKLGFETFDEAALVAAEAWKCLRDGRSPFNEPSEPEEVAPEPQYESGSAPPEEDERYGAPEKMPW